MAALQPIAPAAKRASTVKPAAAAAKAASVVTPVAADQVSDFNSTTPVLLAASELLQTSPAPAKAANKVDTAATQRVETLKKVAPAKVEVVAMAEPAPRAKDADSSGTHPLEVPAPKVAASVAPEPKAEPAASPLGRLAKALASASVPNASVASELPRIESKPRIENIPTPSRPAATSDTQRVPTPTFANVSSARPAPSDAKSSTGATSSMTAALEKWNSSFDLGELSLMATGMWAAAPSRPETKSTASDELSGAEALSLISEPLEQTIASTDPTLKLEVLADPTTEPKLAANAQ
jgi:hypothetical protein